MVPRSLRGHGGHGAQNSSKMKKYLAEKQKQEQKMAQTPCFPRQSLRTSASPSSPTISLLESIDHIRIGAYYEIDHSKLPPRNAPEHFKSVRVVMVSEKGPLKVSVRFPSIQSLQNHVVEKGYQKPQAKLIPALTEKYTMPPELASEVLYRRIPPQEIADKGNVWSFWAVRSPPATNSRRSSWSSPVGSKKGPCWSELKFTGMVKWGKRRKVCYLRRHESPPSSGDEAEKGQEIMGLEEFGNCVYVDDDEEKTEDDEEDVETEDDEEEAPPPPSPPKKVNLRKRKLPARKVKVTPQKKKSKAKGAQRQKQNQIVAVPKQSDKQLVKVSKNTISRWSAGRYKLAEENMLKVMKDKNATVENPMLRPALRVEARKLIGDTGLLDHLLKHMAGKVAPGGAERFRRRHNADGAMEYWLESADLVDIRKESGVEDPFWIPPPGWKLGDNPTQDPTCARQINELKEEIVQLRREMQETKQNQGDLALVTTSSPRVTCLDWDQSSLTQLQDLYAELSVKKAKLEENLMEASHNLSGMEALQERIGVLKCMEEPPPLSDVSDQREATNINLRQKNKAVAATSTEDKAAKIERLRSGFTICRPQGSFLWPDMSISPSQIVVPQVQNDCFVVATPPSAASSSAAHNHLIIQPLAQLPPQPTNSPKPSSAVKPLAERRPVDTNTLCNVTTKPCSSPPPGFPKSSRTSVTFPTKSLILNLNDLPNPNPDPQNSCDTSTALSRPITYHRRHSQQNVVKPKKEMEDGNGARKESPEFMLENDQQIRCSASPSTTASKWMGEKWWLAMGTPSPTSLDNSHRG